VAGCCEYDNEPSGSIKFFLEFVSLCMFYDVKKPRTRVKGLVGNCSILSTKPCVHINCSCYSEARKNLTKL
jgi:hypothetical protein